MLFNDVFSDAISINEDGYVYRTRLSLTNEGFDVGGGSTWGLLA